MNTVGEFIEKLKQFPLDWRVKVATPAGGRICIEHREIKGSSVIAIFGCNGGRFGDNPLTEEEYKSKSSEFLQKIKNPKYKYTSIHGDHRIYIDSGGINDTCYGTQYDRRIIERMVDEGLIGFNSVDVERVKLLNT